ncbi:MAG TPA: T9SS type A sorting domain-containing protein [Ignavibacteria bacterium]|nr:T9SS type A sorting domain-containing protein [Ignavibacteria bacterium]
MKKMIYVLPIIALFAVMAGFLSFSEGDPNADASITINSEGWESELQSDTNRPAGFPFPTLFNFNCATITGLNAGTVGAMFVNGKYYFNRWNSPDYYVYNNSGPGGGPGTQVSTGSYTGSCRDLSTDGRYIYTGKSTTQLGVLYRLDTGNMSTVTTFTLAGQDIRTCAWDRNRRGWWVSGFGGNLVCKDSTGATIQTITTATTAKYGSGWDSTLSQDTAWLWVWVQGSPATTNQLLKFNCANGTLNATYIFTLTGSNIGIAGGAEVVELPGVPNPQLVLLLNYQNFAMVGYKMRDVITGLENTNEAVRDFMLNQNYPNPFNPKTNISFVLTKAGLVNLEVFNTLGEKVATVFKGHTQAGEHEYLFDASNLSSGVYFYSITTGDFRATKKMILVK